MPYASPNLAHIPDELKLDPSNRLLPVDFGFINLNADRAWFADKGLALPTTLEDSADSGLQGLAGRAEPGHLFAGHGFLIGHHRPFWTQRLFGFVCSAGK